MHYQEQYGDYVVGLKEPKGFWHVRMAGLPEVISSHNSKSEAMAAIKRYQAADKRRAKAK
jgi:hypothetical protein